jgi:hypothetical protein
VTRLVLLVEETTERPQVADKAKFPVLKTYLFQRLEAHLSLHLSHDYSGIALVMYGS